MGLQSRLRTNDLPPFWQGLGDVYSFKDFKEDWIRGIIHLPEQVMTAANITVNDSAYSVISNPQIRVYIVDRLSKAEQELERAIESINNKAHEEPLTRIAMSQWLGRPRRIAARVMKKYR